MTDEPVVCFYLRRMAVNHQLTPITLHKKQYSIEQPVVENSPQSGENFIFHKANLPLFSFEKVKHLRQEHVHKVAR